MPLQQTSGNVTADAYGGGKAAVPVYIEDVMSTFLYTGNGSTQTITNGVDLATKGGLVWIKDRSQAASHYLQDTVRGANNYISTNNTNAQASLSLNTVFNTDGFSQNNSYGGFNGTGDNYVTWTFRKAPKFFDVVTYTGNGTSKTISHNLGSAPGCIIIKRTDATAASSWWAVYHRSLANPNNYYLRLDSTNAYGDYGGAFISNVTSTSFDVSDSGAINISGGTYVAYLFAHNAGGFGLTGADNVISCGSYTGTGAAGNQITLGYEAQWVLIKNASAAGNGWILVDNMRGGLSEATYAYLQPNTSGAEVAGGGASLVCATATGFRVDATGSSFNSSGDTFIYIAIRRGPMKVPTDATKVFAPVAYTGNGGTQNLTTNFTGDMAWIDQRSNAGQYVQSFDKLRGNNVVVYQNTSNAEETNSPTSYTVSFNNTQTVLVGPYSPNGIYNNNGSPQIAWNFRRAPGFFDEVCYTGTEVDLTLNHNLGVAPEIIIIKRRNISGSNSVWYCGWNMNATTYMEVILNTSDAGTLYSYPNWFISAPTSTTFALSGQGGNVNRNGSTYVAYLFASALGVSKVGSYTGTGGRQGISCGFTGGARFVLIKRTDSTGNWYVWDTARGMVLFTDPRLALNSTVAEVNTNWVYTDTGGFELVTSDANINASGGTYIFLAIA